MNDEEQKRIFAKNLNYYLELTEKTQREVADAIGVSPQTFNTWCQAVALPRMPKVQSLADYFNITKSDLIDEHSFEGYYYDQETAQAAQEMFENRELRALFDVSRDMSADDLRAVYNIALALKRKERGNEDDTGI